MRGKARNKRTFAEEELPPSRSAKKRNCLNLQKLGEELTKLGAEERRQMELPEELAEALDLHDRITDREARRRQRQYIGRLMREMDVPEIGNALAKRRNAHNSQTALFKKAEKLRDALIGATGENLDKLLEKAAIENGFEMDAQRCKQLADLADKAQREKAMGKNGPSFRQLFREIAALLS